jgi:WD40 repeat protein
VKPSLLLVILLADAGSPARGFDPHNCGVLQVVPALAGDLSAVAFSPDGRLCAVGGTGGVVRVYDTSRWREEQEIRIGEKVGALAFLPDSRRLISGSEGSIRILDIGTGTEIGRFGKSRPPTRSIALHPDGRTLLVVDATGAVSLLDAESAAASTRLRAPEAAQSASFSRPGDAAAVGTLGGIQLAVRKDSEWIQDRWIGLSDTPFSLAFTRDDRTLLVGGHGGLVSVVNLEKGAVERQLQGHQGIVLCLAVTPDDRFALTGAQDGTIRVWDWRKGVELALLKHEGLRAVALHPYGRILASVGSDRQLRVWGYVRGGSDRPKVKGFAGISFVKRGAAVMVSALVPAGPGEQAGLKVGDAVRVIGLTAVQEPATALETIASYSDGEEAVFEIERDGQEKQVRVRIGRRPGPRSP